MSNLLGIDLGGSSIKALVVSESGEKRLERQVAFDATKALEWAERIQALVNEMEAQLGESVSSVGLSAPGLAARDGRSIRNMPGRLSGLVGLDWTDYLQRDAVVPVMNDAQAALMGEAWVGAAGGVDNVLLLTLGTGVGGAVMVDGNVLRGAIGRAGHVGHISLNPQGTPDICRTPGSLELAIGNCTIQERTQKRFSTTHELVAAAADGDAQAREWWRASVWDLACGLASLVNVVDPEVIVIGGGIARAERALFDPLQEFMDEVEWLVGDHRVLIKPAQLGELAGAFGAAIHGHRSRD